METDRKDFSQLTDKELILEKKKLQKAKTWHAAYIGFLGGILGFGLVAWMISPEKHWGFLIPMLIPVVFIYKLVKNSKNNQELEEVLKERGLN